MCGHVLLKKHGEFSSDEKSSYKNNQPSVPELNDRVISVTRETEPQFC